MAAAYLAAETVRFSSSMAVHATFSGHRSSVQTLMWDETQQNITLRLDSDLSASQQCSSWHLLVSCGGYGVITEHADKQVLIDNMTHVRPILPLVNTRCATLYHGLFLAPRAHDIQDRSTRSWFGIEDGRRVSQLWLAASNVLTCSLTKIARLPCYGEQPLIVTRIYSLRVIRHIRHCLVELTSGRTYCI